MSQTQNNQNNKPQQGNKPPREKFNLIDTVVGAEPVSVGYNITGTDIADFVHTYLAAQGITGALVAVEAIHTGTVNPKLGIVVSLNKSNSDIISNAGNAGGDDILPIFTNNIQAGGLNASKRLSETIAPLGAEKKVKVYRARNKKYVYIPVCPIKTISAMLKSVPQFSYISIVDVRRVKGEVVIKAFKQLRESSVGKARGGIYDESMNRHFN